MAKIRVQLNHRQLESMVEAFDLSISLGMNGRAVGSGAESGWCQSIGVHDTFRRNHRLRDHRLCELPPLPKEKQPEGAEGKTFPRPMLSSAQHGLDNFVSGHPERSGVFRSRHVSGFSGSGMSSNGFPRFFWG